MTNSEILDGLAEDLRRNKALTDVGVAISSLRRSIELARELLKLRAGELTPEELAYMRELEDFYRVYL